ncbi:MAG: hypothetical protein RL760_530, partial [Candidatus Eisenbacteria bacterium]
ALAPLALGDPSRYVSLAAVLALLVGSYAVLAGVLRLGFLGELLSKPVLTGYMSGVAIILLASQLGKVTGVDVAGDSLISDLTSFAHNLPISGVSWPSIAIGLGVAVLLIVLTPRFPRVPVTLLVVLAATLIAKVLDLANHGVAVVGSVSFDPPHVGFPDLGSGALPALLLPALGIFIVGYTDNILTARVFALRRGHSIHNNQEFLALGAANIGASLVGGFPASSSASRTVVAEAGGARTQVYTLLTSGLVLLSMLVFGSVIAMFPLAALGGLVIFAALRLVDIAAFRRLWAFRKREFLLAAAALLGVLLFDILYGVLAAVALSIIELLTRVARPHAAVLGQSPGIAGWHDIDDYPGTEQIPGLTVFRYDSPLFFANAEDFLSRSRRAVEEGHPRWLLINMEGNTEVDITGLDALDTLRAWCEEHDVVVALVRVKRELENQLMAHGVGQRIGAERIYPTLPTAVDAFRAWQAQH